MLETRCMETFNIRETDAQWCWTDTEYGPMKGEKGGINKCVDQLIKKDFDIYTYMHQSLSVLLMMT